jgi:outer membrane protein OmpA-like peptidoglycan-associated protein
MKTHTLVTLLLFALIAIPGYSQQNDSSSSAPATSATQIPAPQLPDTALPPLPGPPKDFWEGSDPSFGNLITHPITTKKYVLRHTQPIKDRLNELDELTTGNTKAVKDVDARAQQGLQLASERTTLADQHATEAGSKADAAKLAATQATTHVSSTERMVSNLDRYHAGAQTEIRFAAGQTVLSKSAKEALDKMAADLKGQHNYVVEVRGYTPTHGSAGVSASLKMADSVARYLVLNHEIPLYRIYTEGMGDAPVPGEAKHVRSSRVEINVLKNDVLTAAQH